MAFLITVTGLRHPREGQRNSTVSTAITTAANIHPIVRARNATAIGPLTVKTPPA